MTIDMWEVLVRTPRGNIRPRKFSLLLATLMMASFGYIFAASPTAFADTDAAWQDEKVVYQDKSYEPYSSDSLPDTIADSPAVYRYIDTSNGLSIAHFIFFSSDDPQSEKQATYVRYTYGPPDDYRNENGKKTISVTPAEGAVATTEDSGSSCTIDGIGWIVCPLMNGIAEGMDFIYGIVASYLVVQPITTNADSPVFRIWQVSRDLANVAFIIGFLVIIYRYLVGGGATGYEIRKIVPRLVIAAVLINISYVICAVAVDVSNIAGYGVNQLFESVRDGVLAGSSAGDEINWVSVTTWVLAGGTGAIAGGTALIAATGGAAAGLWFLLAPFLLGAALIVIVTFFILAARQAIIVIAIAIAPLAFAAYILPNTEKWFEKWRDVFFTMLVMFPAFAAVFGGAQLAGELIIRMAAANGSIEIIILGLGVMIAPLAITPLLLKLGGGVLNRFGGIVNNAEKGIFDRYKGYNKDRLDEFRAKQNYNNAQRDANGNLLLGRNQVFRRSAYRQNMKKYNRSRLKDARTAGAEALYNDNDEGIETAGSLARRQYARALRRDYNPSYKYGSAEVAGIEHRSSLLKDYTHARHDEHWQHELNHDANLRGMLTETRMAEGRAKILSGALEAQDDRTFQVALNTDAAYANLRNAKVQASVDSGVADLHKAAIESAGKLALTTTISGDRELRTIKVDATLQQKEADIIESTLQKNAETRWSQLTRTDDRLQGLRLDEARASLASQDAEDKWTSLIENIKAKGNERNSAGNLVVDNLSNSNATVAGSIKALNREIEVEGEVQKSAKYVQQTDFTQALNNSVQLRNRAAGVDPRGAGRVLAAAKAAVTKELITNTDNFQNTLDYDVASDIDELERRFNALPNDTSFIPERVAYARLLARNGSPGVSRLMSVLTDYTAALPPDDDSVMLLKEILAGEQSVKSSSRALEVWSNNERDDSGNLYANFDAVNQTTGIWKSITGQRFASMAQPAQEHALKLLYARDKDAMVRLVQRVAQDPSAMSSIKDKPLRMIQAIIDNPNTDPSSVT